MTNGDFEALELNSDGSLAPVRLAFEGDEASGWSVRRNGADWLELGAGYRDLRSVACGVCSTDLDRQFLPFPLPQVIGHEVLAVDGDGGRFVCEINATRHALGTDAPCVHCATELSRHCVHRLVLGIHDLPGGFGERVLVPRGAIVPVPDSIPDETATLVEPFAAALRAVERIGLQPNDRVAVLGPRRLGMLVIAALDAERRARDLDVEVTALIRREALAGTTRALGADRVLDTTRDDVGAHRFDVVVDTSANPEAFELACELATREVHLKSTHGRPSGGLTQTTAMVVDELTLERFDPAAPPTERALAPAGDETCLTGAAAVVVESVPDIDRAIRPSTDRETGLVRPCGRVLVREPDDASAVGRALRRGVRVGSSRCGDFRAAIDRIAGDAELQRLAERLVTHRFAPSSLEEAFRVARSKSCVKALVQHAPRP